MEKVKFSGDIVIGDPCNIVNSEEDWQLCRYGKRMDKLGFTNFLYIEFPEDSPTVVDGKNNKLGSFCTDSCAIVVVYLSELEKYNPDYEQGFYNEENRTIIKSFDGYVGYRTEHIDIDGCEDEEIVIFGEGNVDFKTVNEEDD